MQIFSIRNILTRGSQNFTLCKGSKQKHYGIHLQSDGNNKHSYWMKCLLYYDLQSTKIKENRSIYVERMVHPICCASLAGNRCFSLSPLILLRPVTSASHQSLFNLLMPIVCHLFKTTHVRHQPIYNYVRALFSVLGENMDLSNGSWI